MNIHTRAHSWERPYVERRWASADLACWVRCCTETGALLNNLWTFKLAKEKQPKKNLWRSKLLPARTINSIGVPHRCFCNSQTLLQKLTLSPHLNIYFANFSDVEMSTNRGEAPKWSTLANIFTSLLSSPLVQLLAHSWISTHGDVSCRSCRLETDLHLHSCLVWSRRFPQSHRLKYFGSCF